MASTGQGSISNQQRNEPPASSGSGFPFTAGSAVNGLSLDALGRIVLGQAVGAVGDPAALLSSREIPLAGFNFQIGKFSGNTTFFLSDGNKNMQYFANAGQRLLIDALNNQYAIGDISNTNNGIVLNFDDAARVAQIGEVIGVDPGLLLNFANRLYQLGDINNIANNTVLSIDDTNQVAKITNGGNPFLLIDVANRDYAIGDILGVGNITGIDILDAQSLISMFSVPPGLDQMFFEMRNSALSRDLILSGDVGGVSGQFFVCDMLNDIYKFGDIDGSNNNGSFIEINDTTSKFSIDNTAHNIGININGVAGFTGTVTPVTTITVNNGIVTNVA